MHLNSAHGCLNSFSTAIFVVRNPKPSPIPTVHRASQGQLVKNIECAISGQFFTNIPSYKNAICNWQKINMIVCTNTFAEVY